MTDPPVIVLPDMKINTIQRVLHRLYVLYRLDPEWMVFSETDFEVVSQEVFEGTTCVTPKNRHFTRFMNQATGTLIKVAKLGHLREGQILFLSDQDITYAD